MDFWGPMAASDDGNRYVLVLTDNLSKYVIVDAFPDCSAKTAAKFFVEKFILVHGAPERLITDNGTHFKKTLMETITQSINIKHAFSTSYHPQTNGQVERFNATFATQLAKYCNKEKYDWDVFLQQVVNAYNTGIHATTRFAPYELAFGR
jgi:transposase InsO family protein